MTISAKPLEIKLSDIEQYELRKFMRLAGMPVVISRSEALRLETVEKLADKGYLKKQSEWAGHVVYRLM